MNKVIEGGEWPGLSKELLFKTLIDEAPTPVGLYVGRELRVSLVNKFILKVWGKDESVVGKTFREALPELEGQPFFQILDDVYTSGIPYNAKAAKVDLEVDGKLQTFYFDFSYTPLEHNGKVWGILNTATDVTDLVLAQRQAAEAEEKLSFALSSAGIGTWNLNIVNNTVSWDERCKELYGFAPGDDVPYESVLAYMHPDDRDKVDAAVQKALDPSGDGSYDCIFRTIGAQDGKLRWLHCKGRAYFSQQQQVERFSGIAQDISEEMNARQKQEELQRQKDDFLGIASHELRTPVTSIKAYAQVMAAMFKKEGNEKKVSMLQKMDGQLNRLTSLIADLLDVTKINTGKLQFNNTTFSFEEMVDEVIDDLQRTTNKHTIEKHFSPTGTITADRDRLIQVLTNLITNAIKYSPHTATIQVHTKRHEGNVEVCVQDFGIGISPEKKNRVFEQFYRVSGDMQHTFPGLGLGLYISSEIIKREGGRIWVNSAEGKGSTFCFSVPDKPALKNN